MDIRVSNRDAWDRQVRAGNRWTVSVGPEVTAAARRGEWSVVLTPTTPVPRNWFPPLPGLDVLCVASGGGQQGPVLAAGLVLTGFFEDGGPEWTLTEYIPCFIATRAVRV